jgi:hypothetical protein
VLFVFVLFLTKNETVFKNLTKDSGLVYNGNEKVGDLTVRDSDEDGVPDWQEGIFGTDPTKKDTNDDGVSDYIEIQRQGGKLPTDGELNFNIDESGNLTKTDELSRDLFSTVATLTQTGVIDQETIDKLTISLSEKIKDSSSSVKSLIYQ